MARTIGRSARTPSSGSVTTSGGRVGTSGTRMPLASATCLVHAPAASTTTGARIGPRPVRTPVTSPPSMSTAVTSVLGSSVAPLASAPRANPTATWAGSKYRSSPTRSAATTPVGRRNGLSRCASSAEIGSPSGPARRAPPRGARPAPGGPAAPAPKAGREHLRVLRPPRDLEAAGVDPGQRLADVVGERLDLPVGVLDELDHQAALAEAADRARGAGRGLRAEVVLVEEGDADAPALGEGVRRRGAEAAGADHLDIRVADHGAALPA